MNCRSSSDIFAHMLKGCEFFIILQGENYNIMSSPTCMWPWLMTLSSFFCYWHNDFWAFFLFVKCHILQFLSGRNGLLMKHTLHQCDTVDVKSQNIFTCLFRNICKKINHDTNFSSFPLSKYHSACCKWTDASDLMKLRETFILTEEWS